MEEDRRGIGPGSRTVARSAGCSSRRRSGPSTTTPGSRSSSCSRSAARGRARRRGRSEAAFAQVVLMVPLMLFSLPAGVLADRVSKRTGHPGHEGARAGADAGRAAPCCSIRPSRRHARRWSILGLLGRPGRAVQPGQVWHPPRDPAAREALVGQRPDRDVRRTWRSSRGRSPAGVILGAAPGARPGSAGLCWRCSRPRAGRGAERCPAVPAARAEGGLVATVQARLVGDPGRPHPPAGDLRPDPRLGDRQPRPRAGADVRRQRILGLDDWQTGLPLAAIGIGIGLGLRRWRGGSRRRRSSTACSRSGRWA